MNPHDYKFLPLDNDGNLVNVAAPEKIASPWDKPIEVLIETCKEQLGSNLRSIYVHGSVARGEAKEGKSDIDMLVLVHI
jgi:uncharacterized protein